MVEPITQYFCLLSFQWFQLLFFVLVWWFVFSVWVVFFFYKEPFPSISRSGIYYLLWFQCNPSASHLLKDGRARKKEISSATLQCYTDYLNTIIINYYFFQWSQKYIILHFLRVQRNVSLLQWKDLAFSLSHGNVTWTTRNIHSEKSKALWIVFMLQYVHK